MVNSLYQEKPITANSFQQTKTTEPDYKSTQKKSTVILAALFVIDLIIPVVIPTAFYIVRRRPDWFKTFVTRLYANKSEDMLIVPVIIPPPSKEDFELITAFEQKLLELDARNMDFAKTLGKKQKYA